MKPVVLITGVGAVIGQGIIKSLGGKDSDYRLIGIDANPDSVGFEWVEARYTVPRVDDPGWVGKLISICQKESADIILPGTEQDVRALIKNQEKINRSIPAVLLLNSPQALKVGLDKWELYLFAKDSVVAMPLTWPAWQIDPGQIPDNNYPLLLKPRKGMAGKGIYRAENKNELEFWLAKIFRNEYIIQQFVGSDDQEYTVSIFGYRDGTLSAPFALKRRLNYGTTFEAETVFDGDIYGKVMAMAESLKTRGPTNFQFRKVKGQYLLLEINPRFSSSTSIKSAFGFNEPLLAVKNFVMGQSKPSLNIKAGRCNRYINDHVVFL